MPVKIIVSYDGTANEDDAVTLGRLLHTAGAEVALAYVRHAQVADDAAEAAARRDAEELLARGAELLGDSGAARHVVTDRSTPDGLAALAEREGADVVVFCSDSHTAKGHVAIGNSASRLLEGGRTAVAIAPVDLAERLDARGVGQVVAIGDGGGTARETADSLAAALGSAVAPVVGEDTGLIVFESRPEAELGQVALSSSASRLIEIATAPVLALPRGRALQFGGRTAPAAA